MKSFALEAVRLGLIRVPPVGTCFPGRNGGPGIPWIADLRGAVAVRPMRRHIVDALADRLVRDFPAVEIVAGLSKAGVPWSAIVGWHLDVPIAIVHLDGPRASGLQRQVEGDVAGRRVVLIDNLSRSGASLRKGADIVKGVGGIVHGALTVIGRPGCELDFPTVSLCSEDELFDAAIEQGQIDPLTINHLRRMEKKS